jgi:hypothetical protein
MKIQGLGETLSPTAGQNGTAVEPAKSAPLVVAAKTYLRVRSIAKRFVR